MLCLHYQFGLAIISLFSWLIVKRRWRDLMRVVSGFLIGFSPVIAMELKTHFYNTKIIWHVLWQVGEHHGLLPAYYFMVAGFLFLIFCFYRFGWRITYRQLFIFVFGLLALDTIYYVVQDRWPTSAPGWTFAQEVQANQIIAEQNPTNFQIINLVYTDPLAHVQKFLLASKQPPLHKNLSTDYYNNSQLFILLPNTYDLSRAINYEINTFVPEATASWSLTDDYQLIEWQR